MAILNLDTLKDIGFTVEDGLIVSLNRSGVVYDLSASNATSMVEQVRGATNMPEDGSTITVDDQTMVLKRVTGKQGSDKGTASVTLEYENADAEGDGTSPASYEGGTSLEQITSAVDKQGNALTVTYKGETKPVEINVEEARGDLTIETVEYTQSPGAIQRQWENRVNSDVWNAGAAGTWRVKSVRWRLRNWAEQSWDFTYQFEYKALGHQPEGVYVDSETNQPPPDWQSEGAFLEVDWYESRNFSSKFPG